MLLIFLEWLTSTLSLKIPAVFYYASTRMILAALTTLLVTILMGPKFIHKLYELKTGQSIRVDDCPMLAALHEKKKHTPTMGGILMIFSMTIALVLWMDLHSSFTIILLVSMLWLGTIGALDDYLKMKHKSSKGLKGRIKFFLQVLFGLLLGIYLYLPSATQSLHHGKWMSPPQAKVKIEKKQVSSHDAEVKSLTTKEYQSVYYLPFKKTPFFTLSNGFIFLGILILIFVVTGSSNAVNLTDGLDGLASGLVLMVASVFAIVAFLSNHVEFAKYLNIPCIEGSSEIAVFLSAMCGASLGFLWYNGHPAQVFMGDTGSLALGGLLGVCAVLLRREFLLALVGGIFVVEALSVILQVMSYRLRGGKRIFLCAPIHHHFEYKGWAETKVVIRFWIIGLILAMIGMGSLKFQ